MKRQRALWGAALVLLTLPGCSSLGDAFDDYPATTLAASVGAVLGGGPPILACAPLTLPLGANAGGWDALGILIAPGVPTGFLAGVAVAAPVAVIEFVIRAPLQFFRRMRDSREAASPRQRPPTGMACPSAIVSSPPGAEVLIDGTPVGRTPLTLVLPNRGTVTVRLRTEGRPDTRQEIQREPGAWGAGVGWESAYRFVLNDPR